MLHCACIHRRLFLAQVHRGEGLRPLTYTKLRSRLGGDKPRPYGIIARLLRRGGGAECCTPSRSTRHERNLVLTGMSCKKPGRRIYGHVAMQPQFFRAGRFFMRRMRLVGMIQFCFLPAGISMLQQDNFLSPVSIQETACPSADLTITSSHLYSRSWNLIPRAHIQ